MKTNRIKLFREKFIFYSMKYKKNMNIISGKNAEFIEVTLGVHILVVTRICHYTVSNILGFLTEGAGNFISSIIDYLNVTYRKVRYIGTGTCHLIVTCQILCYTSISVSLLWLCCSSLRKKSM